MMVLSLGADERVFEKGSAVRQRQLAYARALGQLDLVVLTRRAHAPENDGTLSLRAAAGSSIARLFRAHALAKRSVRPDVVTVQDPFEIGFVGYFVARYFKVPLHVQVHTDFLAPAFANLSLLNGIRASLAAFVLKRASRIRVVSQRIKSSVEAAYHPRAPISVLPIFVPVEQFAHTKAPEELAARFATFKTKLLIVSRLEKEKQIDLAIRAFAEAADQSACLIIVGEGSARASLQALTRALHISDHVFFEAAQDPTSYYALADLVLVPSKYEGYGLVIIEALAAGKPVLSTDVGVARDSGAIVSNDKDFSADLARWFVEGPRTARLKEYPYRDFGEYVRAYCDDIQTCTNAK